MATAQPLNKKEMIRKIIKNKKGNSLVFILILLSNALIVTAAIVFISAIQNRSSGALALTPVAFQKADSGLEYVLEKIHQDLDPTDDIDDICDSFSSGSRRCNIDDPEASVYFLDEDENVLSDSDQIDEIKYIRSVGEIDLGINSFARSLRITLYANP